jgi:hypothetical protein
LQSYRSELVVNILEIQDRSAIETAPRESSSTSESQYKVTSLIDAPIGNRLSRFIHEFETAGANHLFRDLVVIARHARTGHTTDKSGE